MKKTLISTMLASFFILSTYTYADEVQPSDIKVESIRTTALKEHAFAKGLADGRVDKFKELRTTILSLKEQNDKVFNVAHLYSQVSSDNAENAMLQPAIVVTGEDMLQINQSGKNYSHAEVKFEILAPARFVTSQLNWQTFLVNDEDLLVGGPADDPLLSPRTEQEKALMKNMYDVAFREGRAQALNEYIARTETLTTLIVGMYNYHILRTKGIMKPVEIATGYTPVSGNKTQLQLSTRQANVNNDAEFNLNSNNYKAFIEKN